ncbi:hypothetical protein GGQ22_04925 [Nocardioides sp. zg-579]|uniref:Uncharacterized protein n=1 Tax=Nocardioides marmotae TaxID=2663857 RepID=A0A6I3J9G3_9ACTN|nr:hypothetical protein [Nocardioides marmotae]MCR6030786.1 hypothetical protein [Gordonia jinghuaiqii]MTB94420.1 hypothetical protein [Nocardioides marmotae]QKE01557.1 hypothetical protein HPC71_11070 [Nocardioides marmotae]
MATAPDRTSLSRRLETGRLLLGSLLEAGIKAYGAGAALAVALSDAETVGGKGQDALAAVPSLMERYRAAEYVVDHRQEIQVALDYVNEQTPPEAELEAAIESSTATLSGIETTYSSVLEARDALPWNPRDAWGHVSDAWGAKPDLGSIADLAATAERIGPYVDQVEVLTPVYYGGLLAVVDNFASDEIVGTLAVMALALGLAVVLGQAVGFWVRRGRPGLVARTLQRWGARTFRGWYVANLPAALSPPLYAAARERLQRDIAADPEQALDPATLAELERYFASRLPEDVGR